MSIPERINTMADTPPAPQTVATVVADVLNRHPGWQLDFRQHCGVLRVTWFAKSNDLRRFFTDSVPLERLAAARLDLLADVVAHAARRLELELQGD